jgi:cation transport ATPase
LVINALFPSWVWRRGATFQAQICGRSSFGAWLSHSSQAHFRSNRKLISNPKSLVLCEVMVRRSPAEEVEIGDLIQVRPGETSVDGMVTEAIHRR